MLSFWKFSRKRFPPTILPLSFRYLSDVSETTSTFKKPFEKILIANRGEIACRVIRTAKRLGIKTVAVYSEPDAVAKHVRLADEAVFIGPAASSQSYLNIPKILAAIKETGAQAVHPGYGFLSENSHFVEALDAAGVVFIGPGQYAMHAMGDKIESKALAKKAGVNIIPGFIGEVHNEQEVLKIARDIGYPVMIKASAGGGGKGMRVAWNDDEAKVGFRLSKQEARSSFGDDRMLIEKFIDKPRHIEIQILGDGQGTMLYLNERECSIQRRNQKVIEEAPSSFIDPATRRAMGEQAVALANAVGYKSAGTVEMLVDPSRNFYFLEMNTRLQVEHPVTEYITGLDIVEWMLRVAAGEKLPFTQNDIGIKGWAVESRVYAEDPLRNFMPSIGRLQRYREPTSLDNTVRVDSGISEGSEISIHYDPLISKLVTYGSDRQTAINNMKKALDSYIIRGVGHNVSFLREVFDNPRFVSGNISTKFIPEEFPSGFKGHVLSSSEEEELIAAVASLHLARLLRDNTVDGKMNSSIVNTDLQLCIKVEHSEFQQVVVEKVHFGEHYSPHQKLEVLVNDKPVSVEHSWPVDSAIFEVKLNSQPYTLQMLSRSPCTYSIQYKGTAYHISVRTPEQNELWAHMPVPQPMDRINYLRSPMPGQVVSINVKAGDPVFVGEELAIVEAMKMQNVLRAQREGVVKSVYVTPGKDVVLDQILIEFFPA